MSYGFLVVEPPLAAVAIAQSEKEFHLSARHWFGTDSDSGFGCEAVELVHAVHSLLLDGPILLEIETFAAVTVARQIVREIHYRH